MKVKVETYKIVCDCCGDTFRNDNDFTCYSDDPSGDIIRGEAQSANWIEVGNKHYCPDCYEINDNDEIVTKDGHKYDYDTHEELVNK